MKISKVKQKRLYAFLDIVFNIFKKNKELVNELFVNGDLCFISGEYSGKFCDEFDQDDIYEDYLQDGVYSLTKAPDNSLELQLIKDIDYEYRKYNAKLTEISLDSLNIKHVATIGACDEFIASRVAMEKVWIKDDDVKIFSKLYHPTVKEEGHFNIIIEDHDDYGYSAFIRIKYRDFANFRKTQMELDNYDDETGEVISTDEEPIEEETPQAEEPVQPEEQHQEPQQLNLDDLDELDVEPVEQEQEADDPWKIPAMDF